LISDYDVRVFGISGSAIPEKRELAVNFSAYVGKPMVQELPFENPATVPWTFRTSLEGDPSFSVPLRFVVSPTSTYQLPVTFLSTELRECTAQLTIYNATKEATIIYRLTAIVEDPPAEATIIITCKARDTFEKCIDVIPFIHHGRATVIMTVPVTTAPPEVEFRRGRIVEPLVIKGWAPRSGITAGQLKIVDRQSSLYIWYVIEVHVDPPEPEDVIEVTTTVRESATIRIPVHNPKSQQVEFEVIFTEDDFFGPKTTKIDGSETGFYLLVFSPLQVFERTSFISFVNDEEGEFVYLIHCVSLPPNLSVVAPMTAPLGKFASTFLVLENPFDKRISFKIEGDSQLCFQVISKPIFQLGPREKKQLEVRYFPSSLSDLQTSFLTLKSREVGDWFYKLSGTGKNPPPLSPSILECHPGEMTSNAIDFSNPFQSTTKFELSINDQSEVFRLLSKRKIFTLPGYGDTQQVSFTFAPKREGQFKGTLIISTMVEPRILWNYPLVGSTLVGQGKKEIQITARAGGVIHEDFELPLLAENEKYDVTEYKLNVTYPAKAEWLAKIFRVSVVSLNHEAVIPQLVVNIRMIPRRPLRETVLFEVLNPFDQKWDFPVDVAVDPGVPQETIVIEGGLSELVTARITVSDVFTARTAYHAYFASGSANEFMVRPDQGFIESALDEVREFPFDVIFKPKIYGTVMKGLLVVDTPEVQYLYDVVGKIPEYVPPVIATARLDTNRGGASEIMTVRRRNIIRDNIGAPRSGARTSLRVERVKR
jgi:hypothetical protein